MTFVLFCSRELHALHVGAALVLASCDWMATLGAWVGSASIRLLAVAVGFFGHAL
jgi:hypothetical protein